MVSSIFSNSLGCRAIGGALGATGVIIDSLVRTIMDKILEGYSFDPFIRGCIDGLVLNGIVLGAIP